ncbi:BgTH12-02161 [Blumeria graminis f. sp. triticale]|uniref:BgTH12-02161 n=1 Tax=Blumeria graminis f. sp. triticale TaxID=1689686 RepID=A0A9W4D0K7_BLUGR|nr:BgTH12-02161 [Blumeria graminis f. sp. triticale]
MINQALNVLSRLLSFKEHETDDNSMELTLLMHIERSLQQQSDPNKSQGTLNGCFYEGNNDSSVIEAVVRIDSSNYRSETKYRI